MRNEWENEAKKGPKRGGLFEGRHGGRLSRPGRLRPPGGSAGNMQEGRPISPDRSGAGGCLAILPKMYLIGSI